jgi:hypothetical protein
MSGNFHMPFSRNTQIPLMDKNLLEFKNTILEVKLSNKFKNNHKKFLAHQDILKFQNNLSSVWENCKDSLRAKFFSLSFLTLLVIVFLNSCFLL